MKKKFLLLPVLTTFALAGCNFLNFNSSSTDDSTTETETTSEHYGSAYDYTTQVSVEVPDEVVVEEITGEFALSTEDGTVLQNGNVYTLTAAGTYSLSGKLDGQILVEASEDDEVVLELNGVSISYNLDSPIKVVSANKVEISAKKDTGNVISDNRSHKVNDDENQGEGAISAKTDLKLKGNGTLKVSGNYNNGVHTTKDLEIKNETLEVTAYNNAIKGKNSVTISSGKVYAYAQTGNGLKTEDSGLTSKNKQKGTITINGGTVYVDSLHDAIDASYNVEVDQADESVPTSITIACGKKSKYYTSSFKSTSEKGLKAQNDVVVKNGTIVVSASDDAIHANYGETLENGAKSTGNVTIDGGTIKVASGDDGLHSDNTLTINGGVIIVTGATEGLEGNYIVINGGETYVYGTDDGINASKKSFNNCSFTMNGGYLDVAVSNGDTDGIDSNGNFTLTGGTIITRGSPGSGSNMSTGLDVDGTISMTGGTLIAFNGLEKSPSANSTVKYAGTSGANQSNGGMSGPGGGGHGPWGASSTSSSYTFEAGNYTLVGEGINLSFTNDYSYTKFCIFSSALASSATYTLSRAGSTLKSWTQSSNSVTIS